MRRLALAQPPSVREAIAVPWRQAGAIVLGVCAVLALLYLAARETPVFALRTIQVSGGPPATRLAVAKTAQPFLGESLAALNGGALVDELEALPTVRSASYDRAFPSTLRIFVRPEQPLALARVGGAGWIVSERGRIIREATAQSASGLPRYRIPALSGAEPGRFLTDRKSKAVLAALALVPSRFPARIARAGFDGFELTMELRTQWGAPELRLGEPLEVGVKLEVAALVLRSLSQEERLSTAYLDVSVPERTVTGPNPQL